jgi:hypothetical protein
MMTTQIAVTNVRELTVTIITGCADHHHGFLFLAAVPAGGVNEGLAIPFLEVCNPILWRAAIKPS